jgi:hypothetical protein
MALNAGSPTEPEKWPAEKEEMAAVGTASLRYSLSSAGAVERNARSRICAASQDQRQRNLRQTDKGPGDTTTTINGGSRMIGASYQRSRTTG